MKENFLIKKSDGEIERFDPEKIKKSMFFYDTTDELNKEIIVEVEKKKQEEISSDSIYDLIGAVLRKKNKEAFLKYNLTLAISKMGPEGFAFEKFIAQVFSSYNYKVEVGKKIKGKSSVVHEMDIVAERDNSLVTAELKFHNSRSKKTDLKVALYMRARFDDIFNSGFYKKKKAKQFIITNTKFTNNARLYSKNVGINVLSWNYPENNNLYDFILKSSIYPLTALENLSNKAKKNFIANKIVSCTDLAKNNFELIHRSGNYIPREKKEKIIEEIKMIKNFLKK